MDTNCRNILSHYSCIRILLLHQHFSQRAGQLVKHTHDYFLCFRNTCQIVMAEVLHLPFGLSGLDTLETSQHRVEQFCWPHWASSSSACEHCLQDCSVQLPKWVISSTMDSFTNSQFKYTFIFMNSEVFSRVLSFLCHSNSYFLCPFFELPSLVLLP